MTILAPITTRGEFRQITIAPMVILPGDVRQIVGNQLLIIRNNTVIATYDLSQSSTPVSLDVLSPELVSQLIYFQEKPIMGQVVTLTDVRKNTATGSITFQFSNGSNREFSDAAQILSETNYLDTAPGVAEDMLIRKTIVNSPDETNLHTMVGAKCSIDLSANQPVTVTVD